MTRDNGAIVSEYFTHWPRGVLSIFEKIAEIRHFFELARGLLL